MTYLGQRPGVDFGESDAQFGALHQSQMRLVLRVEDVDHHHGVEEGLEEQEEEEEEEELEEIKKEITRK